eukprot:13817554-Ditylum_brightwellii.AAC.1
MACCTPISFCSIEKYVRCPGILLVDLAVAVLGLTAAPILCEALDSPNCLGLKHRNWICSAPPFDTSFHTLVRWQTCCTWWCTTS